MFRTGWGPASWARVVDPGGGDGGGGGRGGGGRGQGPPRGRGVGPGQRYGGPGQQGPPQQLQQDQAQAIAESQQLKELALKKKAFLQLKWDLESNRKHLGKGNLVYILINEQNQGPSNFGKKDINKMLRVSGFQTDDVMGITKNDYRPN